MRFLGGERLLYATFGALSVVCLGLPVGCGGDGAGGWARGTWARPGARNGEDWTILCVQAYGADGRRAVDRLADGLRRARGLQPKYIRIDNTDETHRLYYGTYVRRQNRKTGGQDWPPELRRDMHAIRQLAVGNAFPFLHCRPMPVNQAPVGPPEWDLLKAPGDFSLLIAVYVEISERREAAVQHVKLLREQGEQAYYYHDLTRSHVCVGTYSEHHIKKNARGVPVIDYPEYLAARRRHPHFIYNGQFISNVNRDAAGRLVSKTRQPTRLVRIPKHRDQELE